MTASLFSSVSTALIWMDTYRKPLREQVISSEGGRMQQRAVPRGKGRGSSEGGGPQGRA